VASHEGSVPDILLSDRCLDQSISDKNNENVTIVRYYKKTREGKGRKGERTSL
jgi:hypothetical protein